jgi:AP-3 complex subunit mu
VGFHPCVRLLRWSESSVISFIPPDGTFKLLDYRVPRGTTVNMPIYVKPQFSFHQGTGQVTVMVGTKQAQGKDVTNTVVYIPFSGEVSSVSFSVTHGETFYDPTKRLCTWTIGTLPNDKAPMLTGQIVLGGGKQSLVSRPTITADFRVKGLSCSGVKVTTLGVTNVGRYQCAFSVISCFSLSLSLLLSLSLAGVLLLSPACLLPSLSSDVAQVLCCCVLCSMCTHTCSRVAVIV